MEKMEELLFNYTGSTIGYLVRWNCKDSEFDADGWLEHYGGMIGTDVIVPLPHGGFINMGNFSIVEKPQ